MSGARCFDRASTFVLFVAIAGAIVAGCADGNGSGGGGRRDAGGGVGEGGMDAGGGPADSGPPDTGPPDAGMPDTGPHPTVGTCESCTTNEDCEAGSFCANLVTGGRACLPGCNPDIPTCPRHFTCIFDASGTGVDATICAPVGGPCCVDEDDDTYGDGVGCMGADCNDTDPQVHPDRTEICDGIDTNCNGAVDEPPTDCMSGRCTPDGDGTYSAIASGTCASATCTSGTTTDCGLYTCSDGGTMGTTCASICNPAGPDDDSFCIDTAHCDSGSCVPDVDNGGTCDEDSDCSAAHCDNGFCCGMGTCCSTVADCPGGGAVTRICEDPANCQGSRGMAQCTTDFQCTTVSGIPDDTGCSTTTLAHDCGLYNPIYCNGMDPQTPRSCPTSCVTDTDCVAAAHCAVGVCVPDLPPGGPCARAQDCQDGLSCADNVCCTTSCTGSCASCNLPGTAGTCTLIPSGADPGGECAGFSCSGYYTGFSGGGDVCYRRTDVSDSAAVCNGAGMCVSPDVVCPTQPPGTVQIDCNDSCQAPVPGTCNGTTAGSCMNLDNPSDTTSCGVGVCARTVQRCVGGVPSTCTPGTPAVETCNGLDDNCNGTPDDGAAGSLCPAVPNAASYTCASATCSFTCNTGWANVDGTYSDGCECDISVGGVGCSTAYSLGSITPGGSTSAMGAIAPGTERWFRVDFPASTRPGGGTPRIQLAGASAATHQLLVLSSCTLTSTYSCGTEGGSSMSITDFQFTDDQSTAGVNQWSVNGTSWPATVFVRVTRTTPATTCAEAQFTLNVSR